MFEKKVSYTRAEIHAQVGGGTVNFLPNSEDRVVAACLNRFYDPEAPNVVLVGTGVHIERAADLLIAQRAPVPTFLKRDITKWEYVGEYAVDRTSREPEELAAHCHRSGRDDLTQVIYMAPAH